MPGRYDYLSFVAKAVSDASYLDEVKGTPHFEKITSAERKSLNERAIELSKQVRLHKAHVCLMTCNHACCTPAMQWS